MQYDSPTHVFYIPIHCTWINTRTHKYETYTNYVFCGKGGDDKGLSKAATTVTGGARAATAMTTTMEPMQH